MRWLVLLLLLMPGVSFAAEGDLVSNFNSGEWIVREYLLCDGDYIDGSPPNSCGTIDLQNAASTFPITGANKWLGLPRYIVADFRADNCTTHAAGFLVGVTSSGGERHRLHGIAMQIGSSVSAVMMQPLTHRYISFDMTTEGSGGSCNDQEVVLRLFYDRTHYYGTP